MDEIRESPGYEAYRALESLGWSVYTFRRNFEDLRRLLRYLADDPRAEELLPLRNRDRLHDALREVVRLLHNFVAAAMSLVWHTNRLRHDIHADPTARLHRDSSLDEEMARRIKEAFVEDPLSQFVQKLRAYTQKFGLPSAAFTMSQKEPTDRLLRRIHLPVAELEKWEGWNATAREYLDAAGENIDIAFVVDEYERRVRELYTWFEHHYRGLYSDELAEYHRKGWDLHLLQLENSIAVHPRILAHTSIRPRREEVFVTVFGSDDFASLEAAPDGPERGERAIMLLEHFGPVPDKVKDAIRALYAEPVGGQVADALPANEALWEPARTVRGETIRLTQLVDDSVGETLDRVLFEDCEIVGPVVVVPIDTDFEACTWDVIGSNPREMFWEIAPEKTAVIGAVALRRCLFVRCNFIRVGVAGREQYLAGWQQAPRVPPNH